MKHAKYAKYIRSILVFAGVILLELALLLLFYDSARDVDGEERIETPTRVAHRVLFLGSYNPLYFTAEEQARGLEEGLYPNGIEYDAVYMDARLYPSAEDELAFHDMLKVRLAGSTRGYEALLVGDDVALRFAMKYRNELFEGMPVVFFGINELPLAEQAIGDPLMTGFYENDYLEETLSLLVSLFPRAGEIVALHDDSSAGLADMRIFFRFSQNYPEYRFSDIDSQKLTHEEFLAAIEALPDDAVLVYMTCYADRDGNVYSMHEMTDMIVAHAHGLPIFRNYVGGEGEGVFGGVALDFSAHCRMAGEMVNDILNGADMTMIHLGMQTPSRTVFDYALLNQYELLAGQFPADTIWVNRPESFVERYHTIFLPALLILLGLVLFFLSAEISNRALQRTADALRGSRDDLERSQETLRHQAEYDDFLDILNRRAITEHLHNDFAPESVYSVVMADLDDFKALNEDYGHTLADAILKYMTSLIKEMADRSGWLVGRYGGDEFLFIIPGERLTADHPSVQMLLTLFRMPVPAGDTEARLSASLGIAVSDGETTPDQHIINAEIAMYEAKERGRDGAFLFAEEMKEKMREENRIKNKLSEAFDTDGFYMVYQPQINAQTKEVSGYEALVRMREPGIYPGQFIPVAESNGWIWRIGRITTRLVIEQLAAWRDAGHELHPVSVNYSSNQMNDTGYLEYLENLLKKYDIPPQYIEIEITEGIFLDRTAQATHLFEHLKELGIRLLMDDFGTGYSSLGYLTYIPVDVIKLDKSLVDAYLVDGKDSFVRDVILLVHDLGKEMIIEGVEEEWQYERLRAFGADTIQGYYFSKPIPAEEAIVFQVK